MSAHDLQIQVVGYTPDYFTMIPNMALYDLSPTAYKLLAVYLDTAKTNTVYAKNSTICEKLCVSANTMKKARTELADKGYILFSSGKDGKDTTTARVTIQLAWMWQENTKRMSQEQETVSNSDRGVSNSDTVLSNSDTNNQELYKQEQKETTTKVAESSTTQDAQEDVVVDASITSQLASIVGFTGDDLDWIKSCWSDYTLEQWQDATKAIVRASQKQSIGSVRKYLKGIFDKQALSEQVKVEAKVQASAFADAQHNKVLADMLAEQKRVQALREALAQEGKTA